MENKNFQKDESQTFAYRRTNVVDLIKKTRLKEKKEKRQTMIIAAAAISALALSGFIITN